jgi:hypothetical protein
MRRERVAVKKLVRPAAQRDAVALLKRVFKMSDRRACTVIAADLVATGDRAALVNGSALGGCSTHAKAYEPPWF